MHALSFHWRERLAPAREPLAGGRESIVCRAMLLIYRQKRLRRAREDQRRRQRPIVGMSIPVSLTPERVSPWRMPIVCTVRRASAGFLTASNHVQPS